jgi:uncharacterized protein (DUF697 family)
MKEQGIGILPVPFCANIHLPVAVQTKTLTMLYDLFGKEGTIQ